MLVPDSQRLMSMSQTPHRLPSSDKYLTKVPQRLSASAALHLIATLEYLDEVPIDPRFFTLYRFQKLPIAKSRVRVSSHRRITTQKSPAVYGPDRYIVLTGGLITGILELGGGVQMVKSELESHFFVIFRAIFHFLDTFGAQLLALLMIWPPDPSQIGPFSTSF